MVYNKLRWAVSILHSEAIVDRRLFPPTRSLHPFQPWRVRITLSRSNAEVRPLLQIGVRLFSNYCVEAFCALVDACDDKLSTRRGNLWATERRNIWTAAVSSLQQSLSANGLRRYKSKYIIYNRLPCYAAGAC